MMAGLISDTLMLNSPTTTPKDGSILAWLAEIAGVDAKKLADEIFSSGSVILASPPAKVVRSDFKIYEEEGVRFAVSQVEELGFGNFWQHAKPIAAALQDLRDEERLAFACLLVTDINTQNSLLLVKGDQAPTPRTPPAHEERQEFSARRGAKAPRKTPFPPSPAPQRERAADPPPRPPGPHTPPL